RLLWVSDGLPAAVNDTAAARHHNIPDACRQAGITVLADSGYHHIANGVITPYKRVGGGHITTRELNPGQRVANTALARVRAPGPDRRARRATPPPPAPRRRPAPPPRPPPPPPPRRHPPPPPPLAPPPPPPAPPPAPPPPPAHDAPPPPPRAALQSACEMRA